MKRKKNWVINAYFLLHLYSTTIGTFSLDGVNRGYFSDLKYPHDVHREVYKKASIGVPKKYVLKLCVRACVFVFGVVPPLRNVSRKLCWVRLTWFTSVAAISPLQVPHHYGGFSAVRINSMLNQFYPILPVMTKFWILACFCHEHSPAIYTTQTMTLISLRQSTRKEECPWFYMLCTK